MAAGVRARAAAVGPPRVTVRPATLSICRRRTVALGGPTWQPPRPPPMPPDSPRSIRSGCSRCSPGIRSSAFVIRGYAAVLADIDIVTGEIDITPATDPANLQRLADALEELHAAIRVPNEPAIPLNRRPAATRPSRDSQPHHRRRRSRITTTPDGTGRCEAQSSADAPSPLSWLAPKVSSSSALSVRRIYLSTVLRSGVRAVRRLLPLEAAPARTPRDDREGIGELHRGRMCIADDRART